MDEQQQHKYRLIGAHVFESIVDTSTGEILAKSGSIISYETANRIMSLGLSEIALASSVRVDKSKRPILDNYDYSYWEDG